MANSKRFSPAEVGGLYFRFLDVSGPAETTDFLFASEDADLSAQVRVARIELPCEDDESLWFFGTLGHLEDTSPPSGDERHFLGIFDSASPALAELMGSASHFDKYVARLDIGHTFPLGQKSPLRSAGYTAALVFGADLYQPFPTSELEVGEQKISLFAVIPLSEREIAVKRRHGLDQLLDVSRREGKDWLHIADLTA